MTARFSRIIHQLFLTNTKQKLLIFSFDLRKFKFISVVDIKKIKLLKNKNASSLDGCHIKTENMVNFVLSKILFFLQKPEKISRELINCFRFSGIMPLITFLVDLCDND